MKKLNLNVDYKLEQAESNKDKTFSQEEISEGNASLSKQYIETAILMAHREGLNSQFRRLWLKIQSKIDTAINMKDYVVELEDGEHDFIKNAFLNEKCLFVSSLAQYVVALEDEILSA